MVLCMSLLNNYHPLVTSLEFYEFTRLTYKVVTMKLFNKEFMRKEKGDDSNKGDITLVYKNKKCKSIKKNVRDKSQNICKYCKKKGH